MRALLILLSLAREEDGFPGRVLVEGLKACLPMVMQREARGPIWVIKMRCDVQMFRNCLLIIMTEKFSGLAKIIA